MTSMRDFIRDNRKEIDEVITKRCPRCGRINDEERRQWVLNDEGLYLWAKHEGVRV